MHGVAVAAVFLILFSPWVWFFRGLLLVALLIVTLISQRKLINPIRGLMLSNEGSLSVRFRGREDGFFPVRVLPGATVHPLLVVFRIECEGHESFLIITPDCIDAKDFRRLRVWLKWRAIYGRPDGDD